MTIPPVPFPASREISAGWRRLAPPPTAPLWVGTLWLHRVEAPVTVRHSDPLRPLRHALLGLLSEVTPTPAARLLERLRLPATVSAPLFADLRQERLVRDDSGGWLLTTQGVAAQRHGLGYKELPGRRTFCFVAPATIEQPRFLRLRAEVGEPGRPGDAWRFDPAILATCCQADDAWKALHQFPSDVFGVATEHPALQAWERVIVERAEFIPLFLVGSDGWHGYAAEPRTWNLRGSQPVLQVANDVAETTLQIANEPPSLAVWRQAWTDWARAHGLAKPEADTCELTFQDGRIHVASSLPRDRWRSFHRATEEWLLAGTGPLRRAASLVLPI